MNEFQRGTQVPLLDDQEVEGQPLRVLEFWLSAVREARLVRGPAAAQAVWRQSPLPSLPGEPSKQAVGVDALALPSGERAVGVRHSRAAHPPGVGRVRSAHQGPTYHSSRSTALKNLTSSRRGSSNGAGRHVLSQAAKSAGQIA